MFSNKHLLDKATMEGTIVYKKDAEGQTYRLVLFHYNEEDFYACYGFAGPDVLIPGLQEYVPHTGDIWLHTYEKAGTAYK